MIRAVIFDMDGLIIETESLQSKAYEQIIKEHGKKPIAETNGLIQKIGYRGDDAWRIILTKHSILADSSTISDLRQRKRELYLEILKKHLFPMPGVEKLLSDLKKHNIKIALATGTIRSIVTFILENLKIIQLFDAIITGDEVKKGKPDPEGFIKASNQIAINPKECVVLEDATPGVAAAKRAGMKVIAVSSEFTKDDDFSQEDAVVKSLKDVTWEFIASL